MNNKEKTYKIIALAMSGLAALFGVLFLIFSAGWRSLNKNVRFLESTLTEAVKETSELKSEIRILSANLAQRATEIPDSSQQEDKKEKDAAVTGQAEPTPEEEKPLSPREEKESVADLTLLVPQLDDMLAEAKSAAGGRWSVYIKNLSSNIEAKREISQMKAASLIKLFIMGAVYEHYDTLAQANGSDTLDQLLKSMITASDNDSANQLVTILGDGDSAAGRQAVSAYCEKHNYPDTHMGRMLLEESPTGENYTSTEDCAAFLETLYLKEFDYSDEMLDLLKAQQRRNKIPALIPDGVDIANKTGELSGIENDVAIVYGNKNPYIICVMTDGLEDSSLAVNLIAEMSRYIYGYFNE